MKAMEIEILKRASAYFARKNVLPKIGFRLVQELSADGFDVAVTCQVRKVSRSGYYAWRARPLSSRDLEDAYLANVISDVTS